MSHDSFHIRSSKFPVLAGEDQESVNPGTFGQALANYIKERLEQLGYIVTFLCAEDFGWWLEIRLPVVTTSVICRRAHEDEGVCDFAVVTDSRKKKWSWKRFRSIDITAELEKLGADLEKIFAADPDIEVIGYDFDAYPDSRINPTSEQAAP